MFFIPVYNCSWPLVGFKDGVLQSLRSRRIPAFSAYSIYFRRENKASLQQYFLKKNFIIIIIQSKKKNKEYVGQIIYFIFLKKKKKMIRELIFCFTQHRGHHRVKLVHKTCVWIVPFSTETCCNGATKMAENYFLFI